MTPEQFGAAISRYWRTLALTFVACFATTVAVTALLPRSYTAKATLEVGDTGPRARTLDPGSAQQLTRTYATLAGNANVVEAVRRETRTRLSRRELLGKMSFEPVGRTPLLEIGADGDTAIDAQRLANAYATLFAERIAAQFERGRALAPLTLTEPAARPSSPSKPVVALYLGAGALISLALALAVVLVRDRRERRISVGQDDDVVLEHPVLGRIPPFGRRGGEAPFQDAFRLLKTNVELSGDERPRIVLVTSPAPVEGKTTVAANFAVAAVADGDTAVIVEADLRRPRLEHAAGWPASRRWRAGLTNYLVGSTPIDRILSPHPLIRDLSVVWAGPPPPHPGAMLRSTRMRALVRELARTHDWVVIDAPPVSIGADATVLAPHAEATLCVIDVARTSMPAARAALSQLEKARARSLGIVVNNVAGRNLDGYRHYGETADWPKPGRVWSARARN
jgi:capsular exopolysaccharide synthesis family protein